jgi:DNA-binding XRE family transcriptional regulator
MGNRLRQLREDRQVDGGRGEWTQAWVAERIGCATGTIREWESGRQCPRTFYRRRLARLFGVDPAELGL